jgi:hypothetical protein
MQFLKGLNSEFEGRCAGLFHQPALPSFEEVVAAMAQEEVRLKLTKDGGANPTRSAFIATKHRETRDYYNCGQSGHLSHNCTEPRREMRGRGRGPSRGGSYRGRGRSYSSGSGYSGSSSGSGYFGGSKANLATSEEGTSTVDGTSQPIKGLGTVQCTPAIKLSSALHVLAFPVNLVSLSALVDQIDCRIILDKKICLIQESMTGRKLGT